jgi:hypothetical protein
VEFLLQALVQIPAKKWQNSKLNNVLPSKLNEFTYKVLQKIGTL